MKRRSSKIAEAGLRHSRREVPVHVPSASARLDAQVVPAPRPVHTFDGGLAKRSFSICQ
jgi:hypothetical protein